MSPAENNVLFNLPNVVVTPHLGASTSEAQENVALQVAEQMADYLTKGAISNALNFPSITAEEAPRLKPFISLAEKLGSFAGQLTETGLKAIHVSYDGDVAAMKVKALTSAIVAGVLRPMLADINVVAAPSVAASRGITIEERLKERRGDYDSLITVTIQTERQKRSVSGTVFADGKPRIVDIKGIKIDAEFAPHMLYVTNEDKPGHIGRLGTLLGESGVNIATMALGRDHQGGDAISLVSIDGAVSDSVLAKVKALPAVKQVALLAF
jgi:D-3-phosphoglycerate dehydrogenase / 2-oxoglutarate reductase